MKKLSLILLCTSTHTYSADAETKKIVSRLEELVKKQSPLLGTLFFAAHDFPKDKIPCRLYNDEQELSTTAAKLIKKNLIMSSIKGRFDFVTQFSLRKHDTP